MNVSRRTGFWLAVLLVGAAIPVAQAGEVCIDDKPGLAYGHAGVQQMLESDRSGLICELSAPRADRALLAGDALRAAGGLRDGERSSLREQHDLALAAFVLDPRMRSQEVALDALRRPMHARETIPVLLRVLRADTDRPGQF